MANLTRRQRERDAAQMGRSVDPFRTIRDLLTWDPFSDVDVSLRPGQGMFMPDIEIKETPEALVLKADLPGMKESEIDVSIAGNRLMISGRREEESRREDEQFYAFERQFGSFSRSFILPDTYNADDVKADLKDGVLTVIVPKRPGAQARHVPLTSQTGGQNVLESQSSGQAGASEQTGNGGGIAGQQGSTGQQGSAGRGGSGAEGTSRSG
jgi:HSP20 family protein